jgi:hypothetical protein
VANYGTVANVKTRSGVKYGDLGLADDAALVTFLTELLEQATDLMDRRMRKSYLEEVPIPLGLAGIAEDIVSDALRIMVATRQTPVVRIDDFAIRAITAATLSRDILERLRLYGGGKGASTIDIGQDELADLPVTISPGSLVNDEG